MRTISNLLTKGFDFLLTLVVIVGGLIGLFIACSVVLMLVHLCANVMFDVRLLPLTRWF